MIHKNQKGRAKESILVSLLLGVCALFFLVLVLLLERLGERLLTGVLLILILGEGCLFRLVFVLVDCLLFLLFLFEL